MCLSIPDTKFIYIQTTDVVFLFISNTSLIWYWDQFNSKVSNIYIQTDPSSFSVAYMG